MEGFKEYIQNFVKYPKTAENEIFVRDNFNSIVNKYSQETCISLTTKLLPREIYEEIRSIYKDTAAIYVSYLGAILEIKLKKSIFKKKQEYLYIGIKQYDVKQRRAGGKLYDEYRYFVVCKYSEDDIYTWSENVAKTATLLTFPSKPSPEKPLSMNFSRSPQPVPLYRRLLQRVIHPNPNPKPKRTALYMVPSTSRELSPLIPKKKPDPKKPKSKSSSRSKSSSSHSSIELLTNSSSSSSRKAKK